MHGFPWQTKNVVFFWLHTTRVFFDRVLIKQTHSAKSLKSLSDLLLNWKAVANYSTIFSSSSNIIKVLGRYPNK